MKIQNFSQQGKRSNNEDSVGFKPGLLTVCDGIGGHVSGERASAFVVDAMLQAFEQPRPLGKMDIQQQLNKVQTDLNQLLVNEPELEKMGTTFTGVFITPDVWYAAHIGDSRIYLFRPSEHKLWHTWDHSLVGELMRTHEITIEAGRFHPMSNRIAKAIMAQREGKIASASIVKIDQLKAGDIFLLCSDGVVEGWGDLELVQLFSNPSLSFEEKCQKLRQQCAIKSKDNNTALIAEIEEGDAINFGNNDELEWTTFAEVEADYQKFLKDNQEVTEEPSVPQPSVAQPVQEVTAQEFRPNPQHAPHRAAPQPTRSSSDGGNSFKRFLIPLLIALVLALGVTVFLLLRNSNKKEEVTPITPDNPIENPIGSPDSDVDEVEPQTPAASAIDPENLSRQEEEAQRKREDDMYKKCNTVSGCDAYLREYPRGRYEDRVRQKRSELLEDEAYRKCTTISGCQAYLMKYPNGRYAARVQRKLEQLQAEAGRSNRENTNQTNSIPPKTNNEEEVTSPSSNQNQSINNAVNNALQQNAGGGQEEPNQQINNAVNNALQQNAGGGNEPHQNGNNLNLNTPASNNAGGGGNNGGNNNGGGSNVEQPAGGN